MKVVSPSSCVSLWFVSSSLEAGLASSFCRDLRQGYQSTCVTARYQASISLSNGQILLSLVISSSNLSTYSKGSSKWVHLHPWNSHLPSDPYVTFRFSRSSQLLPDSSFSPWGVCIDARITQNGGRYPSLGFCFSMFIMVIGTIFNRNLLPLISRGKGVLPA